MILIDADALIAQIETNICKPCKERKDDYHGVRCRACQYGDEIDDIDSAPTIEERKTGRWIPQNHNKVNGMTSTLVYYYPKCSVCGHCAYPTNYCPNCGAKMEGEQP